VRELERVRMELLKPPQLANPGGSPPASPPPAPSKPDGQATAKLLEKKLAEAQKARGFSALVEHSGRFVGESGRLEREPAAPPGATDDQKALLARRSFVRRMGYSVVQSLDPAGSSKGVEDGKVAMRVLPDLEKDGTKRAYLIVVASVEDPAPEEFHGKAYARWVADHAYDVPEWRPARVPLADRKGYVVREIYRLYEDWDAYRLDYHVETNTDLAMPREYRGKKKP